jgi:hypothetical protein
MEVPVSLMRRISNARARRVLGWVAVSISTVVASFWAFWGSIENFHEGWYFTDLWRNLTLMFVQYLSPMLIVMMVSLVALRWRRSALPVFGSLALAAAISFKGAFAAVVLGAIPLLVLGGLYLLVPSLKVT